MTYKQSTILTNILFVISLIITILGGIFLIMDVQNSHLLLAGGLSTIAVLGVNEVIRLKKVIAVLIESLRKAN